MSETEPRYASCGSCDSTVRDCSAKAPAYCCPDCHHPLLSPVPLDGEKPDVRVTRLSESDIASANEGIAMAERIEPVSVPATPEGGELADLLARAGDDEGSLAQALLAAANTVAGVGFISKRRAGRCRELILDLASALRRQCSAIDLMNGQLAGAWGAIDRLERELAESHARELLRGVATVAVDDGEALTIRVHATETTGRTLSAAEPGPVEVVVLRATAEGDSK